MTNIWKHKPEDFYFEVSRGNIEGHSVVHKFGRSDNIDNSGWQIISQGEVYQTPTSAVTLELVSSAAADNQAGVGARSVQVEGLDENYEFQSVIALTHATDGTTAVTMGGSWIRVYRAYVLTSGAYATTSTQSHVGTLTIRVESGGATYAIIPLNSSLALGQSLIGAYSVPKGKSAFMGNIFVETESSKLINVAGFFRQNIDIVAAPFSPMRVFVDFPGLSDVITDNSRLWRGNLPEKTDVGFFALGGATAGIVSVEFDLLLVDNDV